MNRFARGIGPARRTRAAGRYPHLLISRKSREKRSKAARQSVDAQERRKKGMKFRTFLCAAAVLALTGASAPAADKDAADVAVEAAKKYAGTTISIVWEAGLQSLDPLNYSGPKWEKLTGIKVRVVEVPTDQMFTKIMQDFKSGAGAYDALNVIPSWMPDLARA